MKKKITKLFALGLLLTLLPFESALAGQTAAGAAAEEGLTAEKEAVTYSDLQTLEEKIDQDLRAALTAGGDFKLEYKIDPALIGKVDVDGVMGDAGTDFPENGDGADKKAYAESYMSILEDPDSAYLEIKSQDPGQEALATDSEAAKIIASLQLTGKSDIEKARAIYSYICTNVVYNTTAEQKVLSGADTKDSFTLGQTAYEALVKKSAIANGYARGMVRLFNEAGMPARVIIDDASGHNAWCIVKVGDLYYNVDAVTRRFLFCDALMQDDAHFRAEKYTTEAFVKKHPMSEINYGEDLKTGEITFSGTDDYQRAFAVLAELNQVRKSCGYTPLVMDRDWLQFAMKRAEEQVVMNTAEEEGEHCPDGSGVVIPRKLVPENSAGYRVTHAAGNSIQVAFLDADMTCVGIGAFKRDDGSYSYYFCAGSSKAYDQVTSLPNQTKQVTVKVRAPYTSITNPFAEHDFTLEPQASKTLTVSTPSSKMVLPYTVPGQKEQEMTYESPAYQWKNTAFTFKSSDPTVVSVDAAGTVKGLREGTATVQILLGSIVIGESKIKVSYPESKLIYYKGNIFKITDVTPEKKTGTVDFVGVQKKKAKCTIPATVTSEGIVYKVTGIGGNAMKNNKKLKKIVIGKNVQYVGKNAFAGCKKLKTVTVKSRALYLVRKGAFKKIAKGSVIRVPKKKLKKYKKLFKKGIVKGLTTLVAY